MSLSLQIEGLDGVIPWLTAVGKGLERVPEKFAAREDVKTALRTIGQTSFDMVNMNTDTGVAKDNIKAESTPDHKGIMVYEALNAATWPICPVSPVTDAYVLFFLTDYARFSFSHAGLSKRSPKDFYKLWPELMRGTVETAFDEEVSKALRA